MESLKKRDMKLAITLFLNFWFNIFSLCSTFFYFATTCSSNIFSRVIGYQAVRCDAFGWKTVQQPQVISV